MRDPNTKLPRKTGGAPRLSEGNTHAPAAKPPPVPLELIDSVDEDGSPDLKDLEKKGMTAKFLRVWNNPATLKQLGVVARLLRAEGIDLKDKTAVKAWAQAHRDKLEAGEIERDPAAEQKPFVNAAAIIGRNDPCPCGSGKKFKKCCHGKQALRP